MHWSLTVHPCVQINTPVLWSNYPRSSSFNLLSAGPCSRQLPNAFITRSSGSVLMDNVHARAKTDAIFLKIFNFQTK